MTLREELEKKFRNLYISADSDVFGVVADEVLRQMEWARTLHGEQWRGDVRDGTSRLVDLDDEPLTLAPEDWKP